MQNIHERLYGAARWILIGFVVLLPIFVLPFGWVLVAQSKGLLAALALILAVIFWVAGSVSEGIIRVPKSALLVAAALLPIAYITSAVVSKASWSSYVGDATSVDTVAAVVLFYVLLFVVASLWCDRSAAPILRAVIVGGWVLVLFSMARLLVPEWTTFGGAFSGTATSALGSWHDLGIFLVFLSFVCITMADVISQKLYVRALAYMPVGISGFLLVIINFKDVWYGAALLFGLCGLLLAMFLWKSGSSWRDVLLGKAGVFIAIAIVTLGLGYGGAWIEGRLPTSLRIVNLEVRPSWQGTIAVGERALSGRDLFFGTGPNTFARDWHLYKPRGVNDTEFWGVDFASGIGTVPTSVVTVGLFGALAWGLIMALLVAMVFRRDVRGDTFALSLVALTIFFAAYEVLYTPGIALSLFAFLFFALMVAHRAFATDSRWNVPLGVESVRAGMALALVCVVALVSIGMGVQTVRRLVSDTMVSRGIIEYRTTGNMNAAVRYVMAANATYPQSDRARRASVELGLLQLRALVADGVKTEEEQKALQEVLSQTIGRALSATAADARDYQNWLMLAELYGDLAGSRIEGAEANARDAYARARETNPTSPLPVLGLAKLELVLGNSDAARGLLIEAIALKPNLPMVHFLLSQIEAGSGNFGLAQESAATVAELVPEDALAWYNLGAILYAAKNYSSAISALERAMALQADYANALFVLALSYYELSDEEKALEALEHLQTLDPSSDIPPRAIKNIKKGRAPLYDSN